MLGWGSARGMEGREGASTEWAEGMARCLEAVLGERSSSPGPEIFTEVPQTIEIFNGSVCACMCEYVYMHVSMYLCVCVGMHQCASECKYVHVGVCVHVCTCVWTEKGLCFTPGLFQEGG